MDMNPPDLRLPHTQPDTSPALDRVAPVSRETWSKKYQLKQPDGTPVDHSIEDTWRRVARALASVERDPAHWEARFYAAMEDFRFLPAGRILSGAGTDRRVTLFNCFVMGDIADDLGSIFDHLREAALTMQQGGGIGYDFSSLRPKGAPVRGVGADASGPLSFMDVWDSMCRTIMSAGSRRGAMMATLRCDHPDIDDFIAVKRDPARLRNFNLSVLVTDAFMAAVDADAEWPLVFDGQTFKTVRARGLWEGLMRSTYDFAEPGVLFIDRINERNNLAYCETIRSTNPCAEQPLPPYGACLLGSINLAKLVREPFTPQAHIDPAELASLVAVAVRMLDNTIDASGFPLEAQRAEATAKRRIGLGMTGLADALAMCGLRYGAPSAVATAGDWAHLIERAAYTASAELGEEKGSFPLFDRQAFLAGETVAGLDADIRATIAGRGIRNGLLTSIAPTGTISLTADNVSSGIEPVFALEYTRKILQRDGSHREEAVSDYALRLFREKFGDDAPLPACFVTAQDLTPAMHVRMQAAVQAHVDSAISKTVNVPADIGFEDFQDVYRDAYRSGCKGCTTFRPNLITGSVLEVKPINAALQEAAVALGVADPSPPSRQTPGQPEADQPAPAHSRSSHSGSARSETELLTRADALNGKTYKLRWPGSAHAYYLTINDQEQPTGPVPFEVFMNSKDLENQAWVTALTRMVSAVFRRGGDVAFVAEELKEIHDPRGGYWMAGRYVPSLVALIGDQVQRHMASTGFLARTGPVERAGEEAEGVAAGSPSPGAAYARGLAIGPACPDCGQPNLIREAGCSKCPHCGWSKC